MSQNIANKAKLSTQNKMREAKTASPQTTENTYNLRRRPAPETAPNVVQQSRYDMARSSLAAAGILALSAPCSPHTLANALMLLAANCKQPKETEKALLNLGEVVASIVTHCEGCIKAEAIVNSLDEFRVGTQIETNDKLDQLDAKLDAKLTSHAEITKAAEKLEEAARSIGTMVNELGSKINKVADSTTQLASTAFTYRDAIASDPRPRPTRSTPPPNDPSVNIVTDKKSRQVLVQLTEEQLSSHSHESLMLKASEAMKAVASETKPEDLSIIEVTKLNKGALLILLKHKDAAEWLQRQEVEHFFTAQFFEGATIKPRQYPLLVPRIPLTLDPENDNHLREIEEANGLDESSIVRVRWIKPAYRRRAEQKVAHATFILRDARTANTCIKDGLKICGMKVYPARLKQEPTQCMKCRKWGHFANICSAEKDCCGTCGGNHRTNTCTESSKRYCVSCKTDTHASWDRRCPEFAKRCTWYDEKHPDNKLKYFPTDDTWTQAICPERIPMTERFPAHFAVASLPPQTKSGRDMPTRIIEKRTKRTHARNRDSPSQTTLDKFINPSQNTTGSPEREEGEVNPELFLSAASHMLEEHTGIDNSMSSTWNH